MTTLQIFPLLLSMSKVLRTDTSFYVPNPYSSGRVSDDPETYIITMHPHTYLLILWCDETRKLINVGQSVPTVATNSILASLLFDFATCVH